MDSELMKQYIDYLNNKKNNNGSRISMLIIYNSFREHLEELVKKKFKKYNYDLAVILSDLTSIC